jgi:hypothetical protein
LHYFKDGKWTALLDTSVSASGGTVTDITVDGVDYKVHTFTTSGDFIVSSTGESVALTVEYVVVGGGGGGGVGGGGGGAGGFRFGSLGVNSGIQPIVIGSGGPSATDGVASSGLGISSAGGGKGGNRNLNGSAGGSGGGGGIEGSLNTGGAGNTPSTSPAQGFNGGNNTSSSPNFGAGGGGGASAVGQTPANGTAPAGDGGAGAASSITGTSVTYAGGVLLANGKVFVNAYHDYDPPRIYDPTDSYQPITLDMNFVTSPFVNKY